MYPRHHFSCKKVKQKQKQKHDDGKRPLLNWRPPQDGVSYSDNFGGSSAKSSHPSKQFGLEITQSPKTTLYFCVTSVYLLTARSSGLRLPVSFARPYPPRPNLFTRDWFRPASSPPCSCRGCVMLSINAPAAPPKRDRPEKPPGGCDRPLPPSSPQPSHLPWQASWIANRTFFRCLSSSCLHATSGRLVCPQSVPTAFCPPIARTDHCFLGSGRCCAEHTRT
ncbi:hypothetical protein RRG08_029381 [Elysia crispata]|uniref:Uncharacterized protein n=1 Tax=Elysia crispata TaxID=231223 RepID=A0AAE1EB88_9GAST|nr:hypothetical protein RRG08_029381 [Elysia crispata]